MSTEAVPYDEKKLPKDAPRITFAAPSSMTPLSTGLATFVNISSSSAVSVTVWFNNGATGHSNAVLEPNGQWSIWVQTGDTYSWAWGNQGVPVGNQRYWINYGRNNVG